ncbi:MAG: AbrB/MazE/SpoVT family DNA-binding domain-containing protein [Fimbriimonas sp.]
MRITSKGQVTIPVEIREKAGLLPETEVEFRFDGNVVTIVKVSHSSKPSRGARLIAQMRGTGDISMTTDEIMALTRGE